MPLTMPFAKALGLPPGQAVRVLVIDDEVMLRRTLADYLEDMNCLTALAANGAEGLEVLEHFAPDVVLVDLNMPVMDGYAFIERVRVRDPELPLIVVSGVGAVDKAMEAIRLGAWDYITKPVSRFAVVEHALSRVLERARLLRENRNYQHNLEALVDARTAELRDTRRQILYSLGKAAEYRDNETGHHVIRVGEMCAALGRCLGLEPARVEMLREAAPLHDIGKIGVPDHILLKPGPLTPEEWVVMQRHCEYGCMILSQPLAEGQPEAMVCTTADPLAAHGAKQQLMPLAQTIALSHHERWDGTGYPEGLPGESIALEARIVSVVDVYDAVGNHRPYKAAFPEDACQRIIRQGAGTAFDPAVVEAFFAELKTILYYKDRWRDALAHGAANS
ncbi:HD-GYP domain-containing protein [Solidesulfovibrio sp.]